jgi:uncharacterized protein YecT (DUF1311 family)
VSATVTLVRWAVLLALAVGTAAAPAHPAGAEPGLAQRVLTQPVRPPPENCQSADRLGLELCAVARFRAAEDELSRIYGELIARAGADEQNRTLLREAQEAWFTYRDKTCAWESDMARGGTAATLFAVNCLHEVTEARVAALKDHIH